MMVGVVAVVAVLVAISQLTNHASVRRCIFKVFKCYKLHKPLIDGVLNTVPTHH